MFYFKDNAELDNLDGVPAEYKSFYVQAQNGGKWTLVEGMKPLATNIDGLRTNLTQAQSATTRANTESAERRVQLEAYQALNLGTTPEEVKAKVDQMTKDLTDGKKINPETIRQEITAQFQARLDESTKVSTDLEGELNSVLVDDAITRGIVENKGNLALLSPIVKSKVAVIKDPISGKRVAVGVNEKGEALPGVDGGFLPVAKVIESLKTNKDFAAAFEGPKQSGGGTPPGGGNRPFVKTPAQQQEGGGQQQKTPMNKITAGLNARAQGGVRQ
jgi:hypothetical protein